MKILFTICGRAGSKGVKNKNLKSLLDIPLIYYALGSILKYSQNHPEDSVNVAVSSDSEELHALAHAQNKISIESVYRDGYLAGDVAPKVSVIAACTQEIQKRTKVVYDVIVDLDITSPLRSWKDIENAVQAINNRPSLDCVFSVTSSRRNPYFNMVKVENGIASPVVENQYTTRQAAPTVYDMNAAIYAYSPFALLTKEAVGFFHTNCSVFIMKDTAILDIDSEEDLEVLEVLAGYFIKRDPFLKETYDAALQMTCHRN